VDASQNWESHAADRVGTAELDIKATRQIAHNFNNLLAVIGGHTDILLESVPSDSPLRRSLSAIQQSTVQAGTLTRKLFEIAPRRPAAPELIEPSDLFSRIEADARVRFAHRVQVDMDLQQPLWQVRGDAAQMKRAIWTITSYAIDAMPYGGAITFRASNADITPDDPRVHPFVKEGRYVRLDVVCRRTLGQQDWLNDFEPIRERAQRDGVDLAAVFDQIKRGGGYLWIGTDEPSGETALTMMWAAV